jgi:hypothetical protein
MEFQGEYKLVEKFEPPPIILFIFAVFVMLMESGRDRARWRARLAYRR